MRDWKSRVCLRKVLIHTGLDIGSERAIDNVTLHIGNWYGKSNRYWTLVVKVLIHTGLDQCPVSIALSLPISNMKCNIIDCSFTTNVQSRMNKHFSKAHPGLPVPHVIPLIIPPKREFYFRKCLMHFGDNFQSLLDHPADCQGPVDPAAATAAAPPPPPPGH
ncbi:hypothetical protein Tco_1260377 [Tanacetum coccineum]